MSKYGYDVVDFCCLDKFADYALVKLFSLDDDYGSVNIIADGNVVNEIIKRFMSEIIEVDDVGYIDFDLGCISFDPEDYDKEYILSLTYDRQIWCEPLWRENKYGTGYIRVESECVLAHEDCDYSVLDNVVSDEVVIFGIEDLD